MLTVEFPIELSRETFSEFCVLFIVSIYAFVCDLGLGSFDSLFVLGLVCTVGKSN